MTLQAIADWLNDAGVPTLRGGTEMAPLKRPSRRRLPKTKTMTGTPTTLRRAPPPVGSRRIYEMMLDHVSLAAARGLLEGAGFTVTPTPEAEGAHGRILLEHGYLEVVAGDALAAHRCSQGRLRAGSSTGTRPRSPPACPCSRPG